MDITETFCLVDDFCNDLLANAKNARTIPGGAKPSYEQPEKLSLSERVTIVVLFHQMGYRNFKTFYTGYVCRFLSQEFQNLISYARFVALMPRTLVPLMALVHGLRGKSRGITFVDSTILKVCNIKRAGRNKVFRSIAKKSKSTMGWFFGFKLHLIVNDIGELVSLQITPGNTDDRKPLPKMTKGLFGKLFGNKGYISKELSASFLARGLQLTADLIRLGTRAILDRAANLWAVPDSRPTIAGQENDLLAPDVLYD